MIFGPCYAPSSTGKGATQKKPKGRNGPGFWGFFLCKQPARHHTGIWVMLISGSLGAVQPWSHFRGLFISVVPHFSSLICIKGPRWPLTPHTSVSEGMCLPDVASFEPQTAKVSKQLCEASVDGSTQSVLAEVFENKPLCYCFFIDICFRNKQTIVFFILYSGFKYRYRFQVSAKPVDLTWMNK